MGYAVSIDLMLPFFLLFVLSHEADASVRFDGQAASTPALGISLQNRRSNAHNPHMPRLWLPLSNLYYHNTSITKIQHDAIFMRC